MIYLQISLFLQELNQSPVDVTVFGIFMATRESALTVSPAVYHWLGCVFKIP